MLSIVNSNNLHSNILKALLDQNGEMGVVDLIYWIPFMKKILSISDLPQIQIGLPWDLIKHLKIFQVFAEYWKKWSI